MDQPNSEIMHVLDCPRCHGVFDVSDALLRCKSCGGEYPIVKGIPILLSSELAVAGFDYLEHYKKDAELFDYFEARTGATEHSERRLREYVLTMIPKAAKSILDVGCGSAWLAQALRDQGKSVCSLDASIVNCAKALELYPFAGHTAVVADAYRLPFKDASFDCVVSTEVIEHVVDPVAFVTELMRVVKPSGSLVISTPYKETLKYELCIHCNHMTPVNAHLHSFDERKLTAYGSGEVSWRAFNNKLLLYARSYIVLKYLPHGMWRMVDKMANTVLPKPVNIVVRYGRK